MAGGAASPKAHSLIHAKRRGRRKALSINTERRFGDGLVSGCPAMGNKENAAAAYLSQQRERRVRKGDIYLRWCCAVFLISLCMVYTAKQYSHRYYASWAITYSAFFLILPTVLPSDNNRILFMLVASLWNCLIMLTFCGLMVRRKFDVLVHGDCRHYVGGRRRFCQWNLLFWSFHTLFGLFITSCIAHAALRLKPADALNRYWRLAGVFFGSIGFISLTDDLMASLSGAYQPARVFRWKVVLSFQMFLIGALCLSSRFKLWMWRQCARHAAITVRISTTHSPDRKPKSAIREIRHRLAKHSACVTS
mmetsp:Transcript_22081/g.69069  ORF Transcript_22081/g.69069 Transcript_22081/m.69069 type:complete len:307 (+) Transcript_22081:104-1024(+)